MPGIRNTGIRGPAPTSPTARNAGVSVALFTGNTMWWKTRWANSQYGNEAYRTLITYKESLDSVQSDPADPPTWTGAWRDPRFSRVRRRRRAA